METLKVGSVKLKNRLFLAPMVDVTDLAYRQICRESGAGMAYIEMLNISAILHENKKTQRLMKTNFFDKPSGIQITGRNVEEFGKIAPYLQDYDIVDVNCGCPSVRITDNSSGSYLLKNPEKIGEMIRILKDSGLKNVTAKIRLGFKKNNVLKVSKIIESAGADALTVHARLASEGSSDAADWKWITQVKKEIGIPVIGNGDVNSGKKAKEMLDLCDGVMIGRAAIGNPLIFENILHYLKTGKEKEFDFLENWKMFERYLKLCEKYGVVDLARGKYLGSKFIRGTAGAAKLRSEFSKLKSWDEMKEFGRQFNTF